MHLKPITVIDVFSLVFAGASSETVCTDSLLIFIRVSRAVFGVSFNFFSLNIVEVGKSTVEREALMQSQ